MKHKKLWNRLPNPIYWGGSVLGAPYGGTAAGYTKVPYAGSDATWNLFVSHTGKEMSVLATSMPWLTWNGFGDVITRTRARGAFPAVSVGTNPQSVISGSQDAAIDAFGAAAASDGKPLILRPFWEMNGTWYVWGKPGGSGGSTTTDAEYVTCWQRLVTRLRAAGANNISFAWCPNYWSPTIGGNDPAPRYPGDDYVDWTGCDVYNELGTSQTFAHWFDYIYDQITGFAPNKPFGIFEWGSIEYTNTATKPNYITDALSVQLPLNYPKVKLHMWYNHSNGSDLNNSGPTHTYPIECTNTTPGTFTGTSLSSAAWRAAIGSSYYASNIVNSSTFPSGAKVPVP